MNKLNYIFFEEFKKLDNLCKDIYQSDAGVTNYINDMKSVPWEYYSHVSNFESDLKDLIRFRHIRNHMAHGEGGFNEEICTLDDVQKIKIFYTRILNGSDPLAIVSKNKNQQKYHLNNRSAKVVINSETKNYKKIDHEKHWFGSCFYWIIILILIALWIFMISSIFPF